MHIHLLSILILCVVCLLVSLLSLLSSLSFSLLFFLSENNKVPYVTLSKLKFEAFARELLLVKKYRLEIYCNKVKSGNDWIISYKVALSEYRQDLHMTIIDPLHVMSPQSSDLPSCIRMDYEYRQNY